MCRRLESQSGRKFVVVPKLVITSLVQRGYMSSRLEVRSSRQFVVVPKLVITSLVQPQHPWQWGGNDSLPSHKCIKCFTTHLHTLENDT